MTVCEKCGLVHVKCAAHKTGVRPWQPCDAWPVRGLHVCVAHGGKTKRAKALAARRLELAKAEKALERRWKPKNALPIDNPMGELAKLAAETRAMYSTLSEILADADPSSWTGDKAGMMALLQIWQEKAHRIIVDLGRLKIDERYAALSERMVSAILSVLDAAIDGAGLADRDADRVRELALVEISRLSQEPALPPGSAA